MVETAIEAAKEGGEIVKSYFETALVRRKKADNSIVTEADEQTEQRIIEIIKRAYPDHAFLGEEGGEVATGSAYTWVIDPLDGTRNFVNGIPIFAVSIALLKGSEHVASVIYNPVTDAMFSAKKGGGSFCNGHQFHVSEQGADSALITIGTSSRETDKARAARVFSEARAFVGAVRFLGSAALELAYLARGGTEGFVNIGTKKWDYAAGTLLVLEAGGTITDFHGGAWNMEQNYFIASNGIIHERLLELMK